MTNTGARTIALYWHNGRSLGHTSRTAKVAQYLLRSPQPYSIAGITGAYRGLDLLPPEVDVIKIPSFANFDDPDGWNLRARLAMDAETLHQARTDLITAFLGHYRPEVLMSDHIPRGTDDELVPALEARYATHAVLSLRGILLSKEKTARKYFGMHGRGPWLLDHYCQFNVHTHPEVFDLADYYDIPPEAAGRLHYTGYLAEPYTLPHDQARAQIGVGGDERLIVAAMGGGQGAGDIWRALATALRERRTMFDRALLVTGPYLEPADQRALAQLWEDDPFVEIRTYEPDLLPWMRACDVFVGAAGSNMLGEVLATGANAIAIPRQVRESEQLVHARRLDELGLVRKVDLPDALGGALTGTLAAALTEPLSPDGTRYLWDGGAYDRHLPGGPGGTACACTTTPATTAGGGHA
ncbi:glycosyltransferase family protein [Streptomyces sp. V4I2]|uniref:glycosyltransferase family protein n=1 Tax=Streptomyces sp. V4I2 TaxID=3042280 RepID=UPI00277D8CCC|nr:glycosyltransferase [Streptomyces sp. V4I2]MDQ1041984.1 putative glycosyltransferase [Streptomyces sp. V4I2]